MHDHAEEEWKPVTGFAGIYEVSDHGRVRSYWTRGGRANRKIGAVARLLATRISSNGYVTVRLSTIDGERREHWIHRMVLDAFTWDKPEKAQAHHKDGCPTNNRLDNLEWVTPSLNCRYREEVKNERARYHAEGQGDLCED